ncbi:hypothetical protein OC845_004373 [Tilletia horrida]|nr:hypothetical protein OC845_004373 [Tilletia horrida]
MAPAALTSLQAVAQDAIVSPFRKDGQTSFFLLALSQACGWIYFVAWSASFYPQAILNFRRKSVSGEHRGHPASQSSSITSDSGICKGLSFDFATLNTFGFLCYTVFNIAFYSSPLIREQYRARHGGQDNVVQLNDVAFAVHALILMLVVMVQIAQYQRDTNQRISRWTLALLSVFTLVAIVTGLLCVITGGNHASGKWTPVEWIDFVQILSSMKLYLPQMRMNAKRKSTQGWSIGNIILDFTGGVFSITQLLIDSAMTGDWSSAIGDFSKLGLGLISIGFDIIFFVQHYILYGPVEPAGEDDDNTADERTRLLPESSTAPQRQ